MVAAENFFDSTLLWPILLLSLVLVGLVGPKTLPQQVALKPEACRYSPRLCKYPVLFFEIHASQAPRFFKTWDSPTQDKFRRALYWDYLFLFIYPVAIAAAGLLLAITLDQQGMAPLSAGLFVIMLQPLAALLDAIENFALLKVLDGIPGGRWPQVARWCAILKFGLVFPGLLYIVIGTVAWLLLLLKELL